MPLCIIAPARVLPEATQRELFRLGAGLDNRIRFSDDVISDYGLASHRDIHGKPPTQNSLQ